MGSLDVLRTFLTVYRAGSATRAAELLGLSQPTVTAQVKSLEADLGEGSPVRPAAARHGAHRRRR